MQKSMRNAATVMACLAGTHMIVPYLSPFRIRALPDLVHATRLFINTIAAGDQQTAILVVCLIVAVCDFACSARVMITYRSSSLAIMSIVRTAMAINCAVLGFYLLFLIVGVALLLLLFLGFVSDTGGPRVGGYPAVGHYHGHGGPVRVHAYYRRDGTRVRSHSRRRPNRF